MRTWAEFKCWMLNNICCYCSRVCDIDSSDPATLACWASWYADWIEMREKRHGS